MGSKKIIWKNQAKDQLRAIDKDTALRILHALASFAATAEGDLKRLQDIEPPEFRLRVGDYRVRFNEEPPGTILVHAVLHRSEAYR
jgi:mRNA interferase RelE/StbE